MQFCSTKHDEGTWRMSEWETEGEDVKIKHASPYLCTMLPLDKNISLAFKCLVGWVYCQFSFYIYIAHTNWALRKFTFLFSLPRSARQHLIVEASLNKLEMMINMLYTLFSHHHPQHHRRFLYGSGRMRNFVVNRRWKGKIVWLNFALELKSILFFSSEIDANESLPSVYCSCCIYLFIQIPSSEHR